MPSEYSGNQGYLDGIVGTALGYDDDADGLVMRVEWRHLNNQGLRNCAQKAQSVEYD